MGDDAGVLETLVQQLQLVNGISEQAGVCNQIKELLESHSKTCEWITVGPSNCLISKRCPIIAFLENMREEELINLLPNLHLLPYQYQVVAISSIQNIEVVRLRLLEALASFYLCDEPGHEPDTQVLFPLTECVILCYKRNTVTHEDLTKFFGLILSGFNIGAFPEQEPFDDFEKRIRREKLLEGFGDQVANVMVTSARSMELTHSLCSSLEEMLQNNMHPLKKAVALRILAVGVHEQKYSTNENLNLKESLTSYFKEIVEIVLGDMTVNGETYFVPLFVVLAYNKTLSSLFQSGRKRKQLVDRDERFLDEFCKRCEVFGKSEDFQRDKGYHVSGHHSKEVKKFITYMRR